MKLMSAYAWEQLARAAVQPGPAVKPNQLLIVRDLEGHDARFTVPPPGVIPRTGAVLLLLYPNAEEVCLPLTVRSDKLTHHRGEVSLPGGSTDPQDVNAAATALRECYEELQVDPNSIEVLGTLSPIYVAASNFDITPVVGWCAAPPPIQFNPAEVSAVLTVSLQALLEPASVVVEQWTLRGTKLLVPYFAISGHKVWGATALILSEFVARLRQSALASD